MPTEAQEPTTSIQLTPIQPPPGWVPGKYAPFPVSPHPMFGPEELGDLKSAIDDLSSTVDRADSAARNWEVLQAWELRLMVRNYQFLNASSRGLGMYGGVNGSRASGAEILQTQNTGKLFSVNVLGARQDKINSILGSDIPALVWGPKKDKDQIDQQAAEAAPDYCKVWLRDAGIKDVVSQTSDLLYTDDRVVFWTTSWADEQEWGTESPEDNSEWGAPSEDSVPETENQPRPPEVDVPAVRELTRALGKLEAKVPMLADEQKQMPWIRLAWEENVNTLKERYPWIEDKISAGATTGKDQLDRMARMNVRLAVQTTNSSGESKQQDATEMFTWYRPSQYRAIAKKEQRQAFFENFPDGLLVVHAGGELAMIRNEGMQRHLKVIHAKNGSGQNRRAIGTNYLPLQKILNANIGLIDRYFRACVPRRFHVEPYINSEAINGTINDPAKSTPVTELPSGQTIQTLTGIENVPQPTTGIFEFVQWLIQGAPEVMDGGEPAMFGGQSTAADQGVYQTAKLKRDAALSIYAVPWSQICMGIAKAAEQAFACAGKNRVGTIRSNIPGTGRIELRLDKMQGEAICDPESLDIPQTISEQEAQMATLLENANSVALYKAIADDPRNLAVIRKFPSLSGLEIPALDAVEQQEGEFELLLQSGPVDNPQVQAIQQQVDMGQNDPEAQTPEGQQAMQQAQQALQSMPPQVSSVPVAQDGSENHGVHAAVTLGWLTSPEGRKHKYGGDDQKLVWQNFKLHWQEHVEMSQKLTPPQQIDFKGTVSVDPSKYASEAQSKIFQAMGLEVAPQELQSNELVPHETTVEKEGVDEQGVPTKQKIAMINPAGKLR